MLTKVLPNMNRYNSTNAALALSALLALGTGTAEAGILIARGELNASATAQIAQTERANPRAGSPSDTIFSVTPALRYHREGARLDLNSSLALPIRRYDENSYLDSEGIDFNLGGTVPYTPGTRLSGSWGIDYFEGVRASYLTNRNLDQERLDAYINSDIQIRSNYSLRANLRHADRSSSGVQEFYANANEITRFALGVHAHNIRGRFGAYVDYFIQDRKTTRSLDEINVDSTDDGINFGLTGQILPERLFPNLDAELSFGYSSTEGGGINRINADRRNRLVFNGSLRYPATPKTNVSLNFSRSLDVSDDDRDVERTRVDLGVNYSPSQRLGFGANLGYNQNDFLTIGESREDDVLLFGLNASYVIRNNWTANAFYNLRDSSSNVRISDYSNSMFGVSTTVSY